MGIQEMLQWWNLVYLVPLFVSGVWLLATVVTGMGGEADHDLGDVSADADHDLDLDHNLDLDADADVDVDADSFDHDIEAVHAHGHHVDIGNHETLFFKALTLVGVGKIPVTVLIGIFLLSWGAFGMVFNRIFASILVFPAVYIWPSMLTTFVISVAFARSLAGLTARFMPTTETYGVSRSELVGRLGKTIYRVTPGSGTVDIADQYGTIHRAQAKTAADGVEINSGSSVIVIDYDATDKRFIVEKSEI